MTPEQEVLFSSFVEKWRLIALSTEPIDRQKAVNSVGAAYELIGKKQPKVIFCRSPYEALLEILDLHNSQKGSSRKRRIDLYQLASQHLNNWNNVMPRRGGIRLFRSAQGQINRVRSLLINELLAQCHSQMGSEWRESNKGGQLIGRMHSEFYFYPNVMAYDFFLTVQKDNTQPWEWKVFGDLITDCGWIFPFRRHCFVCDRPRILSFDSENRLHAEGSPAIQFTDGFSVYAYHGIRLPDKYQKLHPSQWSSEWLLSEENAELRRVLIQGIGYNRLCEELAVTQLDTWQEYSLLRIDKTVDIDPINLLKMRCPSTGNIHVLRVPPSFKFARDAVRWINWGIDLESFSVQT